LQIAPRAQFLQIAPRAQFLQILANCNANSCKLVLVLANSINVVPSMTMLFGSFKFYKFYRCWLVDIAIILSGSFKK
jgi:hypothetical protein